MSTTVAAAATTRLTGSKRKASDQGSRASSRSRAVTMARAVYAGTDPNEVAIANAHTRAILHECSTTAATAFTNARTCLVGIDDALNSDDITQARKIAPWVDFHNDIAHRAASDARRRASKWFPWAAGDALYKTTVVEQTRINASSTNEIVTAVEMLLMAHSGQTGNIFPVAPFVVVLDDGSSSSSSSTQ